MSSELIGRIKQRYLDQRLGRRLIPFDVLKVNEVSRKLTEEALEFLEHRIAPGSTLGASVKPNTICAAGNIRLKNVKGEEVDIRVQIRVGRVTGKNKTTHGIFDNVNNIIVIYLSPWLDNTDLGDSKYNVINTNKSILIHEVTHALDFLDRYKKKEEEGFEAYHNDPHEVRAFARQIVDEAGRVFMGIKLKARVTKTPMPQGARLVEAILDGSKTWLKIKKDLNDANQRYIRQVLVTELDLA